MIIIRDKVTYSRQFLAITNQQRLRSSLGSRASFRLLLETSFICQLLNDICQLGVSVHSSSLSSLGIITIK